MLYIRHRRRSSVCQGHRGRPTAAGAYTGRFDMSQYSADPAPLRDDTRTTAETDVHATEALLPSGDDSSGLSPEVRQQLMAQVQAAGSVEPIVRDLRARIAEVDQRLSAEDDPQYQSL